MAFKGSDADGDRALQLEKLREEQKIDFEKRKQQLQRDDGGLKSMDEAFKSQDSTAEDHFKSNTIGLVSAEEWRLRRIEAETMAKAEEQIRDRLRKKNKRKKDKERKKKLQKLSFADADEDEDEDAEVIPIIKKKKKDPTVQTHFLPDKDREEEEKRMKEKLRKEWEEQQEIIKKEKIQVTYSYWDGSGHRRSIEIEKGTKIEHFLELCRRALVDSFHELRGMSSESLMYIKEDLIIPQHYTFYDLIISKARGKSGPLFHFDVHDDIRLTADARVEKDESHAGKIVTRAYYERNKHVFPVSRWEVYDPSKSYDKYTIR